MTAVLDTSEFATLVEPTTLRIERMLPGPIERIWSYLTDSDKRRKWLASGEMPLVAGATFELTWRNDELTNPPGAKPDGFGVQHSMTSRILAVEAPHRLAFTFGTQSEVDITLEPVGSRVRLILTQRKVPERSFLLNVSGGWHAHLDLLVSIAEDRTPTPFWDAFKDLRQEYDRRLPI